MPEGSCAFICEVGHIRTLTGRSVADTLKENMGVLPMNLSTRSCELCVGRSRVESVPQGLVLEPDLRGMRVLGPTDLYSPLFKWTADVSFSATAAGARWLRVLDSQSSWILDTGILAGSSPASGAPCFHGHQKMSVQHAR